MPRRVFKGMDVDIQMQNIECLIYPHLVRVAERSSRNPVIQRLNDVAECKEAGVLWECIFARSATPPSPSPTPTSPPCDPRRVLRASGRQRSQTPATVTLLHMIGPSATACAEKQPVLYNRGYLKSSVSMHSVSVYANSLDLSY